jgi:hypothetical protein
MLAQSNGKNCQASNFLRVFSANPQAIGLGLTDTLPHTLLLQNFIRFMFENMSSLVSLDGMGVGSTRISECDAGHVQSRPVTTFTVEYSKNALFVDGVCAGISNCVKNKVCMSNPGFVWLI